MEPILTQPSVPWSASCPHLMQPEVAAALAGGGAAEAWKPGAVAVSVGPVFRDGVFLLPGAPPDLAHLTR